MSNKLISIIVILILIVGGFLLFNNRSIAPLEEEMIVENTTEVEEIEEDVVVREFTVNMDNFSFSPNTITVNRGETVRLVVKNVNGYHDLKIDEFNAATRIMNTGEEQTISFVADKSGSFEYYCSVGSHRQMGMVGTLIVN